MMIFCNYDNHYGLNILLMDDNDNDDDGYGDNGDDDDDDLNVALHHIEVGEGLTAKALLRLQNPV